LVQGRLLGADARNVWLGVVVEPSRHPQIMRHALGWRRSQALHVRTVAERKSIICSMPHPLPWRRDHEAAARSHVAR